MLAVRKGQIKEYIPVDLLPRNVRTGEVLESNDFDNDYIQLQGSMAEGAQQKIETTQGTIQYEALLSSYCTALDLCLQGIISPSTLGIDVKKLDNAEAQREKEKLRFIPATGSPMSSTRRCVTSFRRLLILLHAQRS